MSDQGEVFSRDTSTLADDGPDLAAYESPSARHGNPHAGQQEAENQAQRPHFSPVAQPGMTEEIHWGTVRRDQVNHGEGGHHERPSHGMFHRLHQEHGGGKHHGHGH